MVAAETSFTVDRTPPIAGQVYDGADLGVDAQYQDRQDMLCVNWVGFSDPHTGLGRIEWSIGMSWSAKEQLERSLHFRLSIPGFLYHRGTYFSTHSSQKNVH